MLDCEQTKFMWAGELHAASSLPAIPGSCDIKHSNLLVLTFIISPALDHLDFQKIKRNNETLLWTLYSLAFELGPCTKWRVCVRSIQVTLRQKVWFSPKCIKISVNIYFSKKLDIHHFQRVNVRPNKVSILGPTGPFLRLGWSLKTILGCTNIV